MQKTKPRLHYAFVVLALIMLVILGALGLGRFGYSIILPTMQASLQLTNTQAGELQSWNFGGYLLAVVVAGLLAAHLGPRIVISISALIVAGAMVLTGLAPGFEMACWGRALTGLGAGGVNIPAMGLIPAWFGAKRRGFASGAAVAGSSLGLMISGPLVPFVITQFGADQGWRVSWHIFGAIACVTAIVAIFALRNRPAEMGLHPLGENQRERDARIQEHATSSNWKSLCRSPSLWHLALIYFCFGLSHPIYYTFFVRYLVGEGGFTQADAGALWFQVGVGTVVCGFIWGTASDYWGRRTALVTVFTLQGIAILIFGLTRNSAVFYLSACLFSITAWSIPAIMNATCGDRFGARLAPTAFGLITVPFGVGQVIGPVLAGAIADATASFALAFVLAGIVACCGAVGSLFLRQ